LSEIYRILDPNSNDSVINETQFMKAAFSIARTEHGMQIALRASHATKTDSRIAASRAVGSNNTADIEVQEWKDERPR
jgi:hypothetical protein